MGVCEWRKLEEQKIVEKERKKKPFSIPPAAPKTIDLAFYSTCISDEVQLNLIVLCMLSLQFIPFNLLPKIWSLVNLYHSVTLKYFVIPAIKSEQDMQPQHEEWNSNGFFDLLLLLLFVFY